MVEFTEREIQLLGRHKRFYEALNLSRRIPETALQRQFVEVCRGRRAPETDHERAYRKYLLILDEEWADRTGNLRIKEESAVPKMVPPAANAVPKRPDPDAGYAVRAGARRKHRIVDVKDNKIPLSASDRRNVEKYGPKPWKRYIAEDFKKD